MYMDIRLDFIKLRLVPIIESVSYILRKMFSYKFKKKNSQLFAVGRQILKKTELL